MEPVSALENGIPVKIRSACAGDGRAGTVIDDLGSTLRSTLLHEVNAQTAAASDHTFGVDTKVTQRVDGILTDLMGGNFADKGCVHAEIGKGNRNVCLAACVGSFKAICMQKSQVAGGVQSHHNFAEGNNTLFHMYLLFRQ